MAIVEFNTKVRVVQEFEPIEYMEPVSLEAGGGTDMNAGNFEAGVEYDIYPGRKA